MNNFDNILRSMVTLFELTVINNWFVIMEGFVFVTNDWTRLFFMSFYLMILVRFQPLQRVECRLYMILMTLLLPALCKCPFLVSSFLSFLFVIQVVINIVIAFMLEAFTFRIDYRKTTDKDMDEDALVKVTKSLKGGEVNDE